MKRIASIENGAVTNVALWDGLTSWTPQGTTVDVTDQLQVGPGWTYDGADFIAPPRPADPEDE